MTTIVAMIQEKTSNMTIIYELLRENGLMAGKETDLNVSTLTGDGSSRKFWRIKQDDKPICLAVAPPIRDSVNLAEARSARSIGLHLLQQGVRVPEQYGWNDEFGILLFEDLGDTRLHEYVLEQRQSADSVSAIRSYYEKVVGTLATMQIKAAKDFKRDWCWDTPVYDKQTMLERESGYFLKAFWQDFLGKSTPLGLQEEFNELAERASEIPAHYFLHRDFQSRNIMICNGEPCVIDFQGGRLGPLGYDLASLLVDPYVALSGALQEELLSDYMDCLEELISIDREKFTREYSLLALQRNLQIVGAFAFLYKKRKKVFFKQFLCPAVASLNTLLQHDCFDWMAVTRQTMTVAGSVLKKGK